MTQRFRWERTHRTGAVDDGLDALGDANPKTGDAEDDGEAKPAEWFERVVCALRFDHVTAVQANGIDLSDRAQMLELLSLHVGDGGVDLAFAGDKTIRLTVSKLSCLAEDIGQPWPTLQRPGHPEDDQ